MVVASGWQPIYSASEIAAKELPLDVSRAVSIARRVQDPLAELGTDPKHVGVESHQRREKRRSRQRARLCRRKAITSVGVDLNTASIRPFQSTEHKNVAKNIVEERSEVERTHQNRREQSKARRGGVENRRFLESAESDDILDRTAVHTSYDVANY